MPAFATARFDVRPWTLDDVDALHPILGDPRVVWWDEDAGPIERSREVLQRVVTASSDDGPGRGWSAVVDRGTGEVVANVVIRTPAVDTPGVELGWHVAVDHQGRGVATEVGRGAVTYARDVLEQTRVVALIVERNTASRTVAERLGMSVADTVPYGGEPHLLYAADV